MDEREHREDECQIEGCRGRFPDERLPHGAVVDSRVGIVAAHDQQRTAALRAHVTVAVAEPEQQSIDRALRVTGGKDARDASPDVGRLVPIDQRVHELARVLFGDSLERANGVAGDWRNAEQRDDVGRNRVRQGVAGVEDPPDPIDVTGLQGQHLERFRIGPSQIHAATTRRASSHSRDHLCETAGKGHVLGVFCAKPETSAPFGIGGPETAHV
jgi:hypothetical protein